MLVGKYPFQVNVSGCNKSQPRQIPGPVGLVATGCRVADRTLVHCAVELLVAHASHHGGCIERWKLPNGWHLNWQPAGVITYVSLQSLTVAVVGSRKEAFKLAAAVVCCSVLFMITEQHHGGHRFGPGDDGDADEDEDGGLPDTRVPKPHPGVLQPPARHAAAEHGAAHQDERHHVGPVVFDAFAAKCDQYE